MKTIKVKRTVRMRLRPGASRKANELLQLAGACRFAWNAHVARLRDDYRRTGSCNHRMQSPPVNKHGQESIVREWPRFREKHKWLGAKSSAIVRESLRPIEPCYKRFFDSKGKSGPARFKRRGDAPSFPLPRQAFELTRKTLKIQRLGRVRLAGNMRWPPDLVRCARVKREAGKWYCHLVFEIEIPKRTGERMVGIDRNVGQFTASDGRRYETPPAGIAEIKAKRHQRRMARLHRKGERHQSRRWLTAKRRAAEWRRKAAARVHDQCHKATTDVARKYDVAVIEKLDLKAMTASAKGTTESPGENVRQKAGLNRNFLRGCQGKVRQMLSYKMAAVIEAPAAYTSRKCFACAHAEPANRPSQAVFRRRKCGREDNADHNAALNIPHAASGTGASGRRDPRVKSCPVHDPSINVRRGGDGPPHGYSCI